MEIGDIQEFDGVKRKVIGFSVINGIPYPNTEPYTEEVEEIKEPEEEIKEPEEELKCQYCGRVCGSPVGLSSHEKACKENPENKEVTDGNN